MNLHLSKKSILKKTFQVGSLTLLSRILGIIRETLQVRYFGVGAVSDAFITAFKMPNFFRHVFAEGALSASFVPAIVGSVKQGKQEESNGLMTLSFLFFEGIILLMYVGVLFNTEFIAKLIAPGFSEEQIAYTIPFLRILFPFLLFISSSALLAGALQAVNHFFAPAFGPSLMNVFYVVTLILCLAYKLPPTILCFGILLGGIAWMVMHVYFFIRSGFFFGTITPGAIKAFKNVLTKFLPCLFGVSIFEINLFIGGMVASYLPQGSVSLLYYGSRFMNIPLGIFAVALSSILLPHFSRTVLYAPKRLSFYLLEVTKLVSWVILPATLYFLFVSRNFFEHVLLSKKATAFQIDQAVVILMIYIMGLWFFCMNKILLSLFYSMKDTWSSTIASGVSAGINVLGDLVWIYIFFKYDLTNMGPYGIAATAVLAGATLSFGCFSFLKMRHNFTFYFGNFINFLWRYLVQLSLGTALFYSVYALAQGYFATTAWAQFFAIGLGYWPLTGGLALAIMWLMHRTKNIFGIKVYFLDLKEVL